MGYNSRLYVVEKSRTGLFNLYNKYFAEVIAMIEVCKYPLVRNAITKETDCYIYDEEGNTPILEDFYGNPLTEASLQEVKKAVEADPTIYRRKAPLLGLLKSFDENEWQELAVLHFGW